MIRIGYFGDGPWAHKSLKKIVADPNLIICFITVRYDTQDKELIRLAKVNGIPVELSQNINSDEFIKRIEKYDIDLFVSMSFNQIFKKNTFSYPPLGTINCHAGKLPFYRGRNVLNWALINDEKEFGITVHYVDEGIDTGDIILQRCYPITDKDDYRTLLEQAYVGCADVLYDSIKRIQNGVAERIQQDLIDPIGLYCGIRRNGDEIIDWNLSSRRLFNFVRALCYPGPMASSILNGLECKINKVREIKGARNYINTPGQIIGKTKKGFYVKTGDSFIEILDFKYDGKIRVGDRFE